MFDTSSVLWLQQWASPPLTEVMRTVSFLGYVPSCLAVALAYGFGVRFRLGVALILAILFADAATVATKGAFASPRPHAVDTRVETFGAIEARMSRFAAGASVPADDFGFPSGHVAVTTALALGLAWSSRQRWPLAVAAAWIAAMALSRMYLGRHFPADVLGGVAIGAAACAIARLEGETKRLALSLATAVVVALWAAAGPGLGSHDTGRFCGLVGAIVVLVRGGALDDPATSGTRMGRIAVALVLLSVALWSSTWAVAAGSALGVLAAMAISAALHASVLLVPAFAFGRRA
jgi:membrane-associated phospholipid phosphatase